MIAAIVGNFCAQLILYYVLGFSFNACVIGFVSANVVLYLIYNKATDF